MRLKSGSPSILHQPGNASLRETMPPQQNSRSSSAQFLRDNVVWTTEGRLQHNLSTERNLLGCSTRTHERFQLLLLVGVDPEWGSWTQHAERVGSTSDGATHFQLVVLTYGNERLRGETRWLATVPESDARLDQPEQADAAPRMRATSRAAPLRNCSGEIGRPAGYCPRSIIVTTPYAQWMHKGCPRYCYAASAGSPS